MSGPEGAVTPPPAPAITAEEEALLDRSRAAGSPDGIFPTDGELAEATRQRGRPVEDNH